MQTAGASPSTDEKTASLMAGNSHDMLAMVLLTLLVALKNCFACLSFTAVAVQVCAAAVIVSVLSLSLVSVSCLCSLFMFSIYVRVSGFHASLNFVLVFQHCKSCSIVK
jgi:hypothetical protein